MSDPPPDPPHQPDHPMPPAPRSVSPDSPADPPRHYRHTTSPAEEMHKRQKQSISSSSGLNRLGGDVSLPSQSQSSQPILPTVVVPSPPARQTIPMQKNKMKLLNCQHLRKKKQPAVHQRSRRLGRRRSQMTMMSHLGILPDMILHLHPIIIRTIHQICRSTMKVRKN